MTCCRIFIPRQARLNGLQATQYDIFSESAELLDYLLYNPELTQNQMNSLWNLKLIRVRGWKADATEHDKQMVVSTIFLVVRAVLAQHIESRYNETCCDLLSHTLEKELTESDEQEVSEVNQRLIELSPTLCEWINNYNDDDNWLSDQIVDVINSSSKKQAEDFKPDGTTFTKTTLINDTLIDIIEQRLSLAQKLNGDPNDFRKLFSGINQHFTMTWLGSGGELRDFFKMLVNYKYIKPNKGYQRILKSHFRNEKGEVFNNLHGDKSIENFKPIIDDCSFLLQHLTESVTSIMKDLITNNQEVLEEAGYFNNVEAAKQAGMTISNKLR